MGATNLGCRECGAAYELDASYVCSRCFGPLEVVYDHSALTGDVAGLRRRIQGGPQNIWRYADFLPVVDGQPGPSARASSRVGLPAGCTPLIRADRLAERLGLGEVWVKNDAANPTHSFKDRVVSVAATRARELGFEVLACASTGNLANSVAAHAAALGMESYVFIPADLEEQKVLATGVYGTNLVKVRGTYDDVNRLCTELSGERDWAFVNVNLRPYYAEGSKTIAYELAEQLGWVTPDRIVAPVASGSLYTKIAKGFSEWLELGLITGDAPVMHGAQAAGCSPVARAWDCRPRGVPAGAAGHDRQVAGDRQPGRRPVRAGARPDAAAARSRRSPTRRSATASACWRRRPASSPRPPAASRPPCWRSSRRRARSAPTSASCSSSPARG